MATPLEAEALNIDAVFLLGRAAARYSSTFIHISTDYVFDGTSPPYRERDEPRPLNAYGEQKLRSEHAALAAHPRAVVVRVPAGAKEELRGRVLFAGGRAIDFGAAP